MRATLRSPFLHAALCTLILTGCAVSEVENFDALPIQGTGGTTGAQGGTTGGQAGATDAPGGTTGGQAGSTDARGGTTGGQGGSTGGPAGTTGGQAGTTGGQAGTTGGQAGTTGTPDAGAGGRGTGGAGGSRADAGAPDGGAVPTFTELYTSYFDNAAYASNCTGAPCHAPGTQKGLDFSTKAKGYTTILAKLKVGASGSSKVYTVLQSGSMPQARPKWSAADLAKVAAWINAGALNN